MSLPKTQIDDHQILRSILKGTAAHTGRPFFRQLVKHLALTELILEVIHKTPAEIIDHLHKTAAEWLDGSSQDDDMTFFVFKRKRITAENDCNGQQRNR